MKRRLLALFRRLRNDLSPGNAQAVAAAAQLVAASGIVTYDDYVSAMASARERMHAEGSCYGRPLNWHALQAAEGIGLCGLAVIEPV